MFAQAIRFMGATQGHFASLTPPDGLRSSPFSLAITLQTHGTSSILWAVLTLTRTIFNHHHANLFEFTFTTRRIGFRTETQKQKIGESTQP